MGRILSLQTGVPSIATLSIGGILVFLEGSVNLAYGLWAIATMWLISMLVYRRQRVNITILSRDLTRIATEVIRITFTGFIDSRHPDGLEDLELWLHPSIQISSLPDLSDIPHSVNSKPQRFRVSFDVRYSFFNQATEEQQTNGVNIVWLLSAKMRCADWLYTGGIIALGIMKGEGIEMWRSEGRTMKATKKRKEGEGLGINKKQFHELIEKASQPIKKSEKGKS